MKNQQKYNKLDKILKKGKWIKFRELSKNDKIFRVINLTIMLVQFVACLVFGFYYIAVGRDDRLFASFGIGAPGTCTITYRVYF